MYKSYFDAVKVNESTYEDSLRAVYIASLLINATHFPLVTSKVIVARQKTQSAECEKLSLNFSFSFNLLTPGSDQYINSPYNFNTLSSRQVMRIKVAQSSFLIFMILIL